MPLPSRLTVVSKPAASTSPAVDFSSASVRPTPSSWAATSWLSRSSPGCRRRLSRWWPSHVVELTQRRLDPAELPPGEPEVEARGGCGAEPEHLLAVGSGTPRISAITVTGSRLQYVATRSTGRAGIDPVEKIVGDLLGATAKLLDRPDAEDPRDELAVAGVVRRLGHQQGRRVERPERSVLHGPGLQPGHRGFPSSGGTKRGRRRRGWTAMPGRRRCRRSPMRTCLGRTGCAPRSSSRIASSASVLARLGRHEHPTVQVALLRRAAEQPAGQGVAEGPPHSRSGHGHRAELGHAGLLDEGMSRPSCLRSEAREPAVGMLVGLVDLGGRTEDQRIRLADDRCPGTVR